jgi:arylsulfatase A-like enzyme
LRGAELAANLLTMFRHFSRAIVPILFVVGVVSSVAGQSENPPPAPRKPSIIFILADDLGYGDIGCYGQKKIKTPNLDRIAQEGIRFTSFYSGSTVCAPSRAALMTGKHSGHGNIRGNGKRQALRPDEKTIAEVLKEAGYFTGCIGKWGLGDFDTTGAPQSKGFDQFLGYLDHNHAHDYYAGHLFAHDPKANYTGQQVLYENSGEQKNLYTHDLFTQAATNFIRINKPEQINKHRPFFLYLAYTIPHANNEAGKATGNGMQVPSDQPYEKESWPQVEKNKAAMITRMDSDIGKIVELLKKLRIDDNTLILFSSDNGPHHEGGVDPKFLESAGPLRGTKRDLTEGGIRVPMLARWPFRIKQGQTNDTPWAFWDILPTLAEVANVKALENIDGISFAPTLFGKTQTNKHDFLYWEFHEFGFQQAARHGDWKAFRPQSNGPLELYNLKIDIGEKTNVAKANPEIVAKFETYFKNARSENERWPIKKSPAKKSNEGGAPQK